MADQFIIHLLFHPEYIPYEIRPLIPGTHHLPITNPDRLLEFPSEDCSMTDATVPGINVPIPQHFRLLDLPREVRDAIYHEMLCDWPKDATPGHTRVRVRGTIRYALMRHRIMPNILLANKQVYQEAKVVLLKGNQFVLVRMNVRDLHVESSLLVPSNVPVVAWYRRFTRRFEDLVVMTHFISFDNDNRLVRTNHWQRRTLEFILLHRDLQQFCKALSLVNVTRPWAAQSRHEIFIRNPFSGTIRPGFHSIKNQERLLEPYAKELQGFEHFEITGWVQPEIAQAVASSVRQQPLYPDPDTFLEDLTRKKELGDQAAAGVHRNMGTSAWTDAKVLILHATSRNMWTALKQAGGKGFMDRVSELAFQIEHSRAERLLEKMHATRLRIQITTAQSRLVGKDESIILRFRADSWLFQSHLSDLADELRKTCADAEVVGTLLGTLWTPSDEQRARICYFRAQGLRLSEDEDDDDDRRDARRAEHMINRADELLPGDPLIESEAQQIRVWNARFQRRQFYIID